MVTNVPVDETTPTCVREAVTGVRLNNNISNNDKGRHEAGREAGWWNTTGSWKEVWWTDMIKCIAYICNLQQIGRNIVLKKMKVKSYQLR